MQTEQPKCKFVAAWTVVASCNFGTYDFRHRMLPPSAHAALILGWYQHCPHGHLDNGAVHHSRLDDTTPFYQRYHELWHKCLSGGQNGHGS